MHLRHLPYDRPLPPAPPRPVRGTLYQVAPLLLLVIVFVCILAGAGQ